MGQSIGLRLCLQAFLLLALLALFQYILLVTEPSMTNCDPSDGPTGSHQKRTPAWQEDLLRPSLETRTMSESRSESEPKADSRAMGREITWKVFRRQYVERRGRPPPIGMERWFRYAKLHECSLDDREGHYEPIYKDLGRFIRTRGATGTDGLATPSPRSTSSSVDTAGGSGCGMLSTTESAAGNPASTVGASAGNSNSKNSNSGNPSGANSNTGAEPAISSDLVRRAASLIYVSSFRFRNSTILEAAQGEGILPQATMAMKSLTEDYVSDLPDMDVIVNLLDEPRVLLSDPTLRHPGREYPQMRRDDRQRMYYGTEFGAPISALLRDACDEQWSATNFKFFHLHGYAVGANVFYNTYERVPVFSMATIRGCFADIVLPARHYVELEGAEWANETQPDPPWRERKDSVYWRGTFTGGGQRSAEQTSRSHRVRLVHFFGPTSPLYQPDIDVKIAGSGDSLLFDSVEKEDFSRSFRHRYLLDVDGNSFSQRMLVFLRRGTAVLRMNVFEDWLMDRLQPHMHYVPIDLTYSDLSAKFEWLKENPDVGERMAKRSKEYARSRLRLADMRCYTYRLLLEYHHLTQYPF